ncbi:Ig-like domain-containing protein [Methylomonas sp. OY6]|uniref:Ig-like domain-containing protein n=1 Tax=Methylomonas defluvii TaxID=3045149 RepID=A0ABU4UBI8_9GAMM|nr:Ig-like domain-containing protein [Methylomonas sp. OY6]MDX8126801.1 Ig-like domain-containing protein [Methylomonas sp. OY6]
MAVPTIRYYLVPSVQITAPAANAVLNGSFSLTGTASCVLLKDIPGETGLFVRDATYNITNVSVRLGNAAPVAATPTGPAETPWSNWSLMVNGAIDGLLTITATVSAADSPNEAGQAQDSQTVTIDTRPPTLLINRPADVVRPAPPYIATITGTASDNAAGVAAVEWRVGDGVFSPASGTTNWSASVPLLGLGVHNVELRGRDNVGNIGPIQNVAVRVGDMTAPTLNIDSPYEGETFVLANGSVSIALRGSAADTQTGVARVEWSLDGQSAYTAATPRADGDWSTWSAQVPVTTAGNRTITVRAMDKATAVGNVVTLQLGVVVAEPFQPKDPEAVFSQAAYLDDLLEFATHRIKRGDDAPFIDRQLLADTYHQRFTELVTRDNRVVANRVTSQVRLSIEVLRRYLSLNGREIPAPAEAVYRQAAYFAALRHLGVSFDDIRLARVADEPARRALANRLGIELAGFRPDRLDQLLLQPTDISEDKLKTLFGLEESTVKPLADSLLPEPQLLVWQKEQLRNGWQQQDDAAQSAFGTPLPIIDPDLLGIVDFRTPSAGQPAYDLWLARANDLTAHVAALDTARKAQASQLAAFDHIVAEVLGPIEALLLLAEQRQLGNAIDLALREKLLTILSFLHLLRIRQLAAAESVLDAEWQDVYAILCQVRKLGLSATWRAEERQKGLILGPDHFELAAPARSAQVVLPKWRASLQARQAWRRTLDARQQQEQTLREAMQAVVEATEAEALPLLRQACIAAIARDRDSQSIAELLTRELGIDCKSSGQQRTTRAQQALETLQETMLALRTGRVKDQAPVLGATNPAAGWVLAIDPAKPYHEADFDEEWRWMGGYATWNAAIRVFAYPESFLLPELRPAAAQSEAYRKLIADLRNFPRLTPTQARKQADLYHQALTAELLADLPPPLRKGTLVITEQLTDSELASRRDTLIRDLFGSISDPALVPNYLREIFYFVPMALALQLQKAGHFLTALDWIETFYTDHLALGQRKIYRGLLLEETIPTQYQRNPDNWLRVGLNPHEIAAFRASAHTRFTLMTLVRCYLDFADAEFTRDEGESLARARTLYATALELLALPEMQSPTPANATSHPFPPNPVPQALKMRAELNLLKLRSGRNIAGIERPTAPPVQPSLSLDRLPTTGEQRLFRPTPYRYGVLIERAKNLVSIAQQVEQAFLAAMEKRDAESYSRRKADQDLKLADAGKELHGLRIKEADQGIGLAERQRERSAIQRDTYQDWLDEGLNGWEQTMIGSYVAAGGFGLASAMMDAKLTIAQTAVSAAAGGVTGGGAATAAAAAVIMATQEKLFAASGQIAAETLAQVSSAKASFERRRQEWQLQRQLADSEIAIGEQQVLLAGTQKDIALKEQLIADTQYKQAQATLDFLATKFTNEELYSWMSGILGGAYSYFLQQATAMAQLAEYQLAFERQETPPAFIKGDYWEVGDDSGQTTGNQNNQPDRLGLTGSVRLLQDITRLDEFAFESNRRKLQLAETFSLARLFPAEFQRFRDSGRLPFATPMTLFDQSFPGHYLRLIKRIRISIVALVPPVQGVRATLIASGISRIVTGGDMFQSILVRRDPELIAFTSPSNATGLLDLEPEAGMLLPFESMGVDTHWELQLPRAANPFDFRSIADVQFTVEYTALQNFTYRKQVIQQLDDSISAERMFSLRDQFVDAWYDLHNPEQTATPMAIVFSLRTDDFPPNLQDVRIRQVLLAFVRKNGQGDEIGNIQLLLTPDGETLAIGGSVDATVDGTASTRRGNASAWIPLIGKSPAGQWQLKLPDTPEMRTRFKNEEFDDLLLILTYEGSTPLWPQ